jgi:hypothetical protein
MNVDILPLLAINTFFLVGEGWMCNMRLENYYRIIIINNANVPFTDYHFLLPIV